VVIPFLNARELEELPDDVRAGLTFHPVQAMDEVLALALTRAPRPLARRAAREGQGEDEPGARDDESRTPAEVTH
jgi:ATP-dependent Lon protease